MAKIGKDLLTVATLVTLLLALVGSALAAPENEQAWILLERGEPAQALALVQGRSDVLSRWLIVEMEVDQGLEASDDSPLSQAAQVFEQGDFAQASELLQPLLDKTTDPADRLHLQLRLGAAMVETGQIPAAEEILTKAIDSARQQNRTASEFYGLLSRGRARARLRQIDSTREDLQGALTLARRMNTYRWAGVAAIGMSVVSRLQMDLDDALFWREAALEHYRHAGDLAGQAQALHYIATIGILKGDLTRAMTQLQDADALARQADDSAKLGGILGEMAAINYLLGDYDKALNQYMEAVRLAPNPWRKGMMLGNIGSIHEYQGNLDLAVPALEEALQLMQQTGDHRTETQVLQSLGEALCELDQCEKGMLYLDQAIAAAQEFDIPMSEAYAREIKGQVLLRRGELTAAAASFEQAALLAEEIDYFDILEMSLLGQAKVARAEGNADQALNYLERALDKVAEVRRRSGGADRVTSGIVNQAGSLYDEMISLLFELQSRDHDSGYDLQAFEVAQQARARAFLDLMAEAEYDLQVSADQGFRQMESEILNRIIDLETRLENAEPDSVGPLKASLAGAEDELQTLEARLRSENPRYAEVMYPSPLAGKDIQQKVLLQDEVLLEYSLGIDASYLWVMSKNEIRMVQLPSKDEVEKQVHQLLPLLRDYNLTGAEAAWYTQPARDVYEMLLGPVEKEIVQAKRLMICADGILHYLPFEALLSEDTQGKTFSELPWLVNEKIISYAPSASVLGKVRGPRTGEEPLNPWLLIGNPILIQGEDASLFAKAAGAVELPELPFAGQELLRLAALAPAEVLSGDEATLGNLSLQSEGNRLSLVHFASHGLFNEARPRYSGLVLSSDPSLDDDGFLSIPEVLALDLDCDQVVLSACVSALGPHVTGEGVVGLTRSFMFAGARSVVSALWNVSGRETSEFMELYYSNLAADSSDRAECLGIAKRKMMAKKKASGVDLAHPTFWAAFVLSGSGR